MFVDELFEDWVTSKWSRGELYMLVKWFSYTNCMQIEWFPSDLRGELYADQVIFVHELYTDWVISRGESYAGQAIFVHELYTGWVISKWLREVNRMLVKWFSYTNYTDWVTSKWIREVNRMLVKWFSQMNCTQIEWFPSQGELYADWVISKWLREVNHMQTK